MSHFMLPFLIQLVTELREMKSNDFMCNRYGATESHIWWYEVPPSDKNYKLCYIHEVGNNVYLYRSFIDDKR